jgi:hypothetical protein
MATTTRTRSTTSANGSGASNAVEKVKETGATAARRAKGPMLAAGATAAGVAGGLVLGSRLASRRSGLKALLTPRPRVLGVPVGHKSSVVKTAEALGQMARGLSSATGKVSETTDEVRQVREQLDRTNRQSPVEVLLDGLTHRRGGHKAES